jgi:hypothetical protein
MGHDDGSLARSRQPHNDMLLCGTNGQYRFPKDKYYKTKNNKTETVLMACSGSLSLSGLCCAALQLRLWTVIRQCMVYSCISVAACRLSNPRAGYGLSRWRLGTRVRTQLPWPVLSDPHAKTKNSCWNILLRLHGEYGDCFGLIGTAFVELVIQCVFEIKTLDMFVTMV